MEREKCALLEKKKEELDNAYTYAESRASTMTLENEQLHIISKANSQAIIKYKEECKRLTEDLQTTIQDLKIRSEEVHRKQFRIDNLERTVAQLKSKLAAQEASL